MSTTKPQRSSLQQPPDFTAAQQAQIRGPGYGTTVEIKFCTSCSFEATAVTMKKMLEASIPGIDVILSLPPYPS